MSTPNFETLATKEFVKDEIHRVELKIEETKVDLNKSIFQTRVDLHKSIYIAGVIQFLAIVGAIIGIMSFIMKK